MKIPFFIFNMPEDIFVKAEIAGSPYDVRVEKANDPEKPDMLYAIVKDRELDPDKVPQGQKESYIAAGKCPEKKPDAGTTDTYKLIVTANSATEQIMGELPVLRIVLGLSLMLDTTAIGCYMKLRPGRENIRPLKAHDFEPSFTDAALLYIDWSEDEHCIVRWQVSPISRV